MRDGKEHLTAQELLRLLLARAYSHDNAAFNHELEQHLEQCEHCRRMKEEYRPLMSKLFQFGQTVDRAPQEQCPPPATWGELAAGLLPQKTAFSHLQHAVSCAACNDELQNALYALDESAGLPVGVEPNQLASSSEAWQKDFAAHLQSQRAAAVSMRSLRPGRPGIFSALFARPWAVAAVAAVAALAIGLGIFFSLHRDTPDTLIRQAYAQQRTIEMRIPGAGYGPIQVERASERSSMSSPRPLLEAEVLIKNGLEKSPDNPELLRQKAEADLLAWNYQPAIETLNHATRLRPDSFPLLVDLATAYFERAEATSSPADYEAGLESLGQAVRLEPSNPAALFNRAILYERLYFYDRAIADWEQILKIERDPQWKEEAQRRLKEIRARQRERGERTVPEKLSPERFRQDLETRETAAIEEYVEAAERSLLPAITAPLPENAQPRRILGTPAPAAGDARYQAALALAEKLRRRHSDPFLDDLLASAPKSDFHSAALLLGQSSTANHSGHFERAYDEASRAAALFRRSGNSAGWLASLFEQSYALQFESQAGRCRTVAATAAASAQKLGYAFLEAQLLLEDAICSNMSGAVGAAKETVERALAVARDHGYQSLYLRGLNMLATLETDAGEDTRAWSAIQEGLALYWKSDLPPVRAYSFYTTLDQMAGRLGHANVQFAALSESLKFRAENPNRVVEAAEHARLGGVALRLGDLGLAEEQFAQAERIFAAEPPSGSVRWRQLEAHINLVRVQSLRGGGADAERMAASLAASLPEVEQLSNRYLEFFYYDTLAGLKIRAGDTGSARRFLEQAIDLAETGAASLPTWREKQAWMELHRAPFAAMATLLLDSGRPDLALQEWQRYRLPGADHGAKKSDGHLLQRVSLPIHGQKRPANEAPATSPGQSVPYVLTYAFVPSGLAIWVRHGEEVHAARIAVSEHGLQRTAESFLAECSRPGSDLSDLRADAHTLYQWLVQPVSQWLPSSGNLVVEPDGVLGALPFEALVDDASNYLGVRYAFSIALIAQADTAPESFSLPAGSRALIVAAPAASVEAPPPGALAEAMHVAARFQHPSLLLGRDANVLRVTNELPRNAIFHFAGHAGSGRDGAALLLADGPLRQEGARPLDHLELAVFSACGTARLSESSSTRSLVSSFLQAGARNVAASRWNVDSIATEDFMGLFYDSLLSGRTPAEALQAAAGSFRQLRSRTHPYYWAAFAAFRGSGSV